MEACQAFTVGLLGGKRRVYRARGNARKVDAMRATSVDETLRRVVASVELTLH